MWIDEVFAHIQFFSVSDELNGDGTQETKPKPQPLLADDSTSDTVEVSDRSVPSFQFLT